jgi:catechol 2,3-dioxygenase-like lactoylglutathione lyase family enzyme
MAELAIDHAALPCFDVRGTLQFYGQLLGIPLVHAQTGPAGVWGNGDYLMLAFQLPDGSSLDFFTFDGITLPANDGLPKDIRHIGLVVATRAEVMLYKERFVEGQVPFWTETHDVDDLHLYVTDPNGAVIEILSAGDARAQPSDPDAARPVVERWLATHESDAAV